MKKEILIGTISAVLGAVITVFLLFITGALEKKFHETHAIAAAKELKTDENFMTYFFGEMEKDGRFKGSKGDPGPRGERGGDYSIHVERIRVKQADCKHQGAGYIYTGNWSKPFKSIKTAFIGRTVGNSAGHAEVIPMINSAQPTWFQIWISRPWLSNWPEDGFVWEFEIVGVGEF